ncbi:hypothetical protein RND81_06G141200 [Saponaria officinalis]|uniref:Cystatin domain-containing protein n=1 Tax=Saponaria officinalis TaxID=3572 RepID=A0AAW1KCX3_SAPOF
MNTRSLFIVLALLAVTSTAYAAVGKRGSFVGGYTPIKDLHSAQVQEIAKYAVTEYNKKSGTSLVYVKTVKGESQVVSGANYRLVISAKDGGAVRNYMAVVYEKSWAHYRSLTSFNAV